MIKLFLRMLVAVVVSSVVMAIVDGLTGAKVVGGKYVDLHDIALFMIGFYGFCWMFKERIFKD